MPTLNLRSLLLVCVLGTPLAIRAQLGTASPFMPPQGASTNAPTADAPLEFRGVAELPDGRAFRLVDPARKRGAWLKLNERDSDLGIVVKQHDPARETVTVEQQGRTFTLALHQSKVSSAGAVVMNAPVPVPQMQVPTIAQAVQAAPAAPIQQSQMDAVAAAVAQRRAQREQAMQQLNVTGRVTPPVQPQQPPAGPRLTDQARGRGNPAAKK